MRRRRAKSLVQYITALVVTGAVFFSTWTLFGQPDGQELVDKGPWILLVFGISMLGIVVATVGPWLAKKVSRIRPNLFTFDVDYEGAVVRIKPDFSSENIVRSLVVSVYLGVMAWGFGRILITQYFFDSEGFRLGFFEIYSILYFIPIILFLARQSFLGVKKAVVAFIKRRAWLEEAKKAEALIVDRQVEAAVETEGTYQKGKQMLRYELVLKIGGQLFRAMVSEGIFRKYIKRDLVNVFYAVGSPQVFVIQGE